MDKRALNTRMPQCPLPTERKSWPVFEQPPVVQGNGTCLQVLICYVYAHGFLGARGNGQ